MQDTDNIALLLVPSAIKLSITVARTLLHVFFQLLWGALLAHRSGFAALHKSCAIAQGSIKARGWRARHVTGGGRSLFGGAKHVTCLATDNAHLALYLSRGACLSDAMQAALLKTSVDESMHLHCGNEFDIAKYFMRGSCSRALGPTPADLPPDTPGRGWPPQTFVAYCRTDTVRTR